MIASVVLLTASLVGGVPPHSADPGTAARAPAQEAPCTGPSFSAFDFWVGAWVVRNAAGEEVGRNTIRKVADGCALLESWTSAGGSTGTSLNFYDPVRDRWTQVWVGGGDGTRLHLEGGLEDGAMVLQGERVREGESVRDRITWTPMDDGTVRQTWDISTGGEEWETSWEGIYHPVEEG